LYEFVLRLSIEREGATTAIRLFPGGCALEIPDNATDPAKQPAMNSRRLIHLPDIVPSERTFDHRPLCSTSQIRVTSEDR